MKANRNRKQTKSQIDSTEIKGTLYSYNSCDDLINSNDNNIRFQLPNGLVLREKKKTLHYLISPPKQYKAKPKNPSTIALLPSMKLVNDNKPWDRIDSIKDSELSKWTNTHPYTKRSTVTSTNQLSKSTSRKNTKQSTVISSYPVSHKDSVNCIERNYFNEVKGIQKEKSCSRNVLNNDKAEIVSHIYSLSLFKRMNSLIANNK